MITKSEEHDIDRAGQLLLRLAVADLGWVIDFVASDDYGIDCNVQVFQGKFPSGVWFHVQLKSSNASAYSSDGAFISQELSVSHARHYALELRQPVFLIHADVRKRKVLWHSPQLDTNLASLLNNTSAKTITVRIPALQEIPANAAQMLSDLRAIYLVLANREIVSSSADSFAVSLKHLPDQEELRRKYQEKCDVLKLRKVATLRKGQEFKEARIRIASILADLDSAIEIKFQAQVHLRSIDYTETLFSGASEENLYKVFLNHAVALRRLTQLGPNYLKFHSIIAKKAAELGTLTYENSVLYMAQEQHLQRGGNPMAALHLYMRRSVLSKLISAKYNQCLRLALYATTYPDRWSLGHAITEIVNAIAPYLLTLRSEKHKESEQLLARSALHFCQLAAWIAEETGDLDGVVLSIISALATAGSQDSDAFRWAALVATAIIEPEFRRDAISCVNKAARRWNGEHVDGDYVADNHWQIIRKLANANGMDTSDENGPLVRSLRIAARDNNPERVLAQCEHLLASQGAIGPNAQTIRATLNIHTAGSKVIHCLLHNFHVEGKELDTAYEEFKRTHCDSCPDVRPRPPGWRYRGKVREEIEAANIAYIARFAGLPFGRRYTAED